MYRASGHPQDYFLLRGKASAPGYRAPISDIYIYIYCANILCFRSVYNNMYYIYIITRQKQAVGDVALGDVLVGDVLRAAGIGRAGLIEDTRARLRRAGLEEGQVMCV